MYKKGADGITKKGKTEGKNLGDSGPTVAIQKQVRGSGGKKNTDMKKMGRGLAKVAAQKRG